MNESEREAGMKRFELDMTNLNEFTRNAQRRIRAMTEEFFEHATPGDLSTMEVLLREHNTKTADQGDSLAIAMGRLMNGDGPLATSASGNDEQANESTHPKEEPCTLHELRKRLRASGVGSFEERWAFFAAAMNVETDLPVANKASITVCERMLRANEGCDTPIEDFLDSFLSAAMDRALTISDLKTFLATAEQDFESITRTAQRMVDEYPALVMTGSKEEQ